jgi:hypothetical protein
VDPLEIVLGHRPAKRTTGKYAIFHSDYLKSIRDGIEALWSEVSVLCRHPCTQTTPKSSGACAEKAAVARPKL